MFILLPCRRVTRMPELPWGQPPFLSKFPYKTWQTIYIRNKTLARLEAKSFSWPDKRLSLQPSKVNSVKARQSEHTGALSALHSGERGQPFFQNWLGWEGRVVLLPGTTFLHIETRPYWHVHSKMNTSVAPLEENYISLVNLDMIPVNSTPG